MTVILDSNRPIVDSNGLLKNLTASELEPNIATVAVRENPGLRATGLVRWSVPKEI